jgi:hypothetical protein
LLGFEPRLRSSFDYQAGENGMSRSDCGLPLPHLIGVAILGGGEVDSPPQTVAGMVSAVLEPDGSLDHFVAVPPQVAPVAAESRSATDWNTLFAESGLDPKRFQPEPPAWISPVPFDASVGWKGTYEQDPTATIHVSAAALRGHPVYFQVIAPWNAPDRDQGYARPSYFAGIVTVILTFKLSGVGFFMAWRNLIQGRGDQKGAVQLRPGSRSVHLAFSGSSSIGAGLGVVAVYSGRGFCTMVRHTGLGCGPRT